MSVAENTRAVAQYNWRNLPQQVAEANATTIYKESHGLPDHWGFEIREQGLYDATRGGYVHDLVKKFPNQNPYLQKVEDAIIGAMDNWAIAGTDRYLIWISPLFSGVYPTNKIEVLQKSPNRSETNNFSISFNGTSNECLSITKELFPELSELTGPEELRISVIAKDNLDLDRIMEAVAPYLPKSDGAKEIPKEAFTYIAKLVTAGVSQLHIALEMKRLGIIGEQSFSCPGGLGLSGSLESSSLNLTGASDQYGERSFACPKCGAINVRPHGQFISCCQHCGGDVRC